MTDRTNALRRDEHVEEKDPTFWDYFSVPRLIFFAIVVFYLLFGATVLHVLEKANHDQDPPAKDDSEKGCKTVDLTKVVEQLWDDSQNEEISEEEWKIRTKETIEKFDRDGDEANEKDNDEDDNISWTFAQSFLYTTATLTRIGSNLQPETFFGRIFVLLYTFFGIPLLLIFFADLGKIFVNLLQTLVEHVQRKLNFELLPSISTGTGDINVIAFVLAVSVVLFAYVIGMSFLFRIWCGGSIFGNIYSAFLIAFGVGPAPIGGTETCANAGIIRIIPALVLVLTAPIAWSLTNMQTDLMGTEYIRKIHVLLKRIRKEKSA